MRSAPRPPEPVPVHCVVPPAPVHDAVYVVDCDGETDTEPPLIALAVAKLVPVHVVELAAADVHESVDEFPRRIDVGDTVSEQSGATLQAAFV